MQKVLLISYYWPPAGGPGVQRWLQMTKYLPDNGIQPILFIPENPNYPIVDGSLVKDVSPGLKIIKHPIWEPYQLAQWFLSSKSKEISSGIIPKDPNLFQRAALWIRGNLFIPDARKYWVKSSVKRIDSILKQEGIKTVITTGPPHSIHLIGMALKQEHSVRWIADFRDPWTSISYHDKLNLGNRARKKHKLLEKEVLSKADIVTVTSGTTAKEFSKICDTRIEVVTNGFDKASTAINLDQKFSISHIGSLLTQRNPTTFWKVIADFVKENHAICQDLVINLIGVVSPEVGKTIVELGISQFIEQHGYLTHKEVMQYQAQSQVLLLLEGEMEVTKGIIPGKLFEYFSAKRPILAIGPKGWEAGRMVEDHKAGNYLLNNDKSAIRKTLLHWHQKYRQSELKVEPMDTGQYHRPQLAKKMSEIIKWES